MGWSPLGVAYDSANGNIYVANQYSNTVSIIDGSTNTVIDTIPVGLQPAAVAFDSANDYTSASVQSQQQQQS